MRVAYGLSGEGRGHAVRAITVGRELLKAGNHVQFISGGEAMGLLHQAFRGIDQITYRYVRSIRYVYDASGKISTLQSAIALAKRWFEQEHDVKRIVRYLDEYQPDLTICDFEPFVARATARVGVPAVSIDHQHGLLVGDFSKLSSVSFSLRMQVAALGTLVHQLAPGRQVTVISGFHHPPLLPEHSGRVHQVGVFMRRSVKERRGSNNLGPHLVAYLRKSHAKATLKAMADSGEVVKVYGLGAGPGRGKISFHAIDEEAFVDDLAASRGLITGAGNQLLGEALYLNKPVLAMPEFGSAEQEINAALLRDTGLGYTTTGNAIAKQHIVRLISEGPKLFSGRDTSTMDGLPDTMKALDPFLF